MSRSRFRMQGIRALVGLSALLVGATAMAQVTVPSSYAVFVSTGNDNRIVQYEYDPTPPGTITQVAIYSGPENNFRPSDMVVGPDGLLYICDPSSSKIWRMQVGSGLFQLIYQPSFGGDPFSPNSPEGAIFGPDAATGQIVNHDSLYFNTTSGGPNSHSGLWRLDAIARVPFGSGPLPEPQQILTAQVTGSQDGEGTAWMIDGRLLFVDRTNHRVLAAKEDPVTGWGLAVLIPDTGGDPVGLAVSSHGDVYVGLDDSREIVRFNRVPGTLDQFQRDAAFSYSTAPLEPHFMDFDAADTLWLASSSSNSHDGDLRRIVFRTGAPPDVLTASLAHTPMVGTALPVTAVRAATTYVGGAATVNLTNTELRIALASSASCPVEVTVEEFNPDVLNALITPNFPLATCVRYAAKGGRCVRYHVNSCVDDAYEILVKFFSDTIEFPGLLHDYGSDGDEVFDEDILVEYLPNGLPGDLPGDPAMRGGTGGFSDFVAVDLGELINHRPVARAGMDQTLEATSGAGASVTLDGSASFDADAGYGDTLTYSWTLPDGTVLGGAVVSATLPLGTSVVTLTVEDSSGAQGTDSITIIVVDTTLPVFSGVPADRTVEATALPMPVTLVPPTASDLGQPLTVTASGIPAGSLFPLGSTTVTWTAVDGSGNTATAMTTIVIVDTTVPTITVAPSVTVEAAGPLTPVTLVPPVVTDADPNVSTTNNAPAAFPLGSTTVTWTAVDGSGNTATATTLVIVVDTTAPLMTHAQASPDQINSVNHKLVRVEVSPAATDLVGVTECRVAWISHSEAINDTGDGDTDPDWFFDTAWHPAGQTLSVQLRAERSGTGSGSRQYGVAVQCRDASGNVSALSYPAPGPHASNWPADLATKPDVAVVQVR